MATREDATLLVQMLHWGTDTGLDGALRHIFSDGFQTEPSREDMMNDPEPGKVLFFCESAATFVKHGVLDGDLLRDLLWIEGIWERVRGYALAARAESGEPRLYENIEAVATHTIG
jgi:hypothetical protein